MVVAVRKGTGLYSTTRIRTKTCTTIGAHPGNGKSDVRVVVKNEWDHNSRGGELRAQQAAPTDQKHRNSSRQNRSSCLHDLSVTVGAAAGLQSVTVVVAVVMSEKQGVQIVVEMKRIELCSL